MTKAERQTEAKWAAEYSIQLQFAANDPVIFDVEETAFEDDD